MESGRICLAKGQGELRGKLARGRGGGGGGGGGTAAGGTVTNGGIRWIVRERKCGDWSYHYAMIPTVII